MDLQVPAILAVWCLFGMIPGCTAFRDDYMNFVSFYNTSEWSQVYSYTCSYTYDLFREPREFTHRDELKSRYELQTPIMFNSKDTLDSPWNETLHIYNNKPVRSGFSVSYGFPQDKECLHGQDSDCVVVPELGRVRAVVLQANRFDAVDQSLNNIKDEFLVEDAEKFVAIVNGGSSNERKFYEAVFLGGYGKDPKRSSHVIDGKSYPLEIYMFFLDETVPSVSLSTLLVVLVEEVEFDNPQVKPIVATVKEKLYVQEGRYIQKNRGLERRERLYHHMKGSVYYDPYSKRLKPERHEPLDSSAKHEAIITRYTEPYENVQALSSVTFFDNEDIDLIAASSKELKETVDNLKEQKTNLLFPYNQQEMYNIIRIAIRTWFFNFQDTNNTRPGVSCKASWDKDLSGADSEDNKKWFTDKTDEYYKQYSYLLAANPSHKQNVEDLYLETCQYLLDYFGPQFKENNDDKMRTVSTDRKIALIEEMHDAREIRTKIGDKIFEHFHGKKSDHKFGVQEPEPEYRSAKHKTKILDGMATFIKFYRKHENYENKLNETNITLNRIAMENRFDDRDQMLEVANYLKYGDKENDPRYTRSKLHKDLVNYRLPGHKKKLGLVEHGGMNISEDDVRKYEHLRPTKVVVAQKFQISWLMPDSGGYYHYKGSSPLPPCYRVQNVIVFKKPIQMSRYQIDALTRVPISFDRSQDILTTQPVLHDTTFEVDLVGPHTKTSTKSEEVKVEVYNSKRNHLFLGLDSRNKNAIQLNKKFLAAKKNGGAKGMPRKLLIFFTWIGLIILG